MWRQTDGSAHVVEGFNADGEDAGAELGGAHDDCIATYQGHDGATDGEGNGPVPGYHGVAKQRAG